METRLLKAILGRETSFLQPAIDGLAEDIRSKLADARVLVIGAAGSIGGAFVKEICGFRPKGLHLVDIAENNLVEVVRDLRAGGHPVPDDFRTFAIDYGGPEMKALLSSERYGYVMNFSALKHVRSERDPFTLMRLLEVNVLANDRLMGWLLDMPGLRGVFSVSSDKSVRPANLMGASKALMERLFLKHSDAIPFTSARFANVAFSDGSLLHGFLHRIAKRQPLSAPNDVRRYFITHREAGQLCLLGCFTGSNREIYFPKFDPDRDMRTFADIARIVLREHGFEPKGCDTPEEALRFMAGRPEGSREWACHFSASDTMGEKPYEEFHDPGETVDLDRFGSVGVVTRPLYRGAETVDQAVRRILSLRESGAWTKDDLIEAVRLAVPELDHVDSDKNLDQKM